MLNAAPGQVVPGDDDRFATTGCGTNGTTGEPDSRCSSSVFVWQSGGLFLIGFRGELADLDVTFSATPVGAGTATDLVRTDGITYDTLETLDIRLGAGNDRFNVRGTLPHTLLNTGPGDDVVFVSDAADLAALPAALLNAGRDLEALHEAVLHGTVTYDDLTFNGSLDEIDGNLDIEVGAGSNTLAVSDHADADADTGFVIDNHSITGLSTGAMTYAATGGDLAGQGAWTRGADGGMFGRGITIHLGTGNDVGTIASVLGGAIAASPFGATVTSLYANYGNDRITVNAPNVAAALLVINGDEGDDTIDGTNASLALTLFGDQGSDTLKGGTSDDRIFGDDGRVHYLKPVGATGFDIVFGGDPDGPALPATGDGVFLTPDLMLTRDVTIGTGDDIYGGLGNDIVLAGAGADHVSDAGGSNVVLGDFGFLTYAGAGIHSIVPTDPTIGAGDIITISGVGNNIVLGETGKDVISTGDGGDLVFGDFGRLDGTIPLTLAPPETVPTFTYVSIFTGIGDGGDNDIVLAGDGRNIVIGGQGNDVIAALGGDDDLIGGHNVASGATATTGSTAAAATT